MTCHSGGTLEIYVEPHLPAPVLWIAGTTPIAGALVAVGAASGWRVSVFDPVASAEDFPLAERVSQETALGRVDPDDSPYVVVATQGVWDEEALAAGLRRNASYVGLVASPTRANVVRQWLRDETGLAIVHDIERRTRVARRHDGLLCHERLVWDHSVVLVDRRVVDAAAARVQIGELRFADAPRERHAAVQPLLPGDLAEALAVGTVTGDHESHGPVGGRSVEREVDPLRAVEPVDGEDEIVV